MAGRRKQRRQFLRKLAGDGDGDGDAPDATVAVDTCRRALDLDE